MMREMQRATEELGRRFQDYDINCVAVLIGRPESISETGTEDAIEVLYNQLRQRRMATEQIETYTRQEAAGSDECWVVLLVPEGHADRAIEILEGASTRDGDDLDAELPDKGEGDSDGSGGWSWWAPMLVAAAFVIAAILLLRVISSQPPPSTPAPRPPASGGAQ